MYFVFAKMLYTVPKKTIPLRCNLYFFVGTQFDLSEAMSLSLWDIYIEPHTC